MKFPFPLSFFILIHQAKVSSLHLCNCIHTLSLQFGVEAADTLGPVTEEVAATALNSLMVS